MRRFILLSVIALTACASPDTAAVPEVELSAVRQVSMSGTPLSWQELRVHPALLRRACAVGTLVNVDGEVVGYCRGGRQCRTNDWRPVAPGCNQSPEYHAGPAATPPAPAPAAQPNRMVDLAVVR